MVSTPTFERDHVRQLGSGPVIAFSKLLGQLRNAGTTTLAHYLEMLAVASLAIGLQKFARTALRRRASSPTPQVFAPALTTALDARHAAPADDPPSSRLSPTRDRCPRIWATGTPRHLDNRRWMRDV